MQEYMKATIFHIINIFRVILLKKSQFMQLYFPGNFPYQNQNNCLKPIKIYYIQPKFNDSKAYRQTAVMRMSGKHLRKDILIK